MKAIRTITLAGYILATIFINSCDERREVQVESPDGSYEFTCYLNEDANEIFYSLSFKGEEVIHASRLGFVFSKEKVDRPEISIEEVVRKNVNSSWRPVYGERDEYPEDNTHIIEEKTEFALPPNTILWASDRAQSEIYRMPVSGIEKPGQILENNYLILNLNEPNRIEDTSWIKPGKVIREVTLTTKGGKACVDFAVKHNLQFVEFDAGWYGHEYDDVSDATTISVDPKRSKGPLDIHEVISYAESKGIGIILYVNRRALEKQLDNVLPLLRSWGIKGVKYGFVNVGPQEWTTWLHDAVRKAADHH